MATPRPGFGKTWWGEQWLDALAHIDYDNRLPRGRAYANKGAVKDLRIDDGVIHARVAGSRPQPYKVSIGVPPIPEKDARRLLDAIAADPALIARLLNRELDPAVLALAKELGIAVFPRQWQDLAMNCSCPDWAVPCKHLAAAIYLLSREIDGNPFLVFSLRGIDLAAGLKSRDVLIEREAGAALPTVAELLAAKAEAGEVPAGAASEVNELDELDFSLLPALADALLQVLPEKPAFAAAGDFRATLQRVLARVAKAARQALDAAPSAAAEAQASRLHADDRPRIELDAAYTVKLSGLSAIDTLPALLDALDGLDAARLPDLQPELAALHPVRLLALHLLARGAVVPQVFALGKDGVGLRWLPATLDPVVRDLLQRLRDGLPAGLVVTAKGRRHVPLAPATQAGVLCSLCLDHYLRRWSAAASEKPLGDKTVALFFGNGRANYDGPGEGAVAAGIQAWLARFHLAQRAHAPLLCLDEAKAGDFALSLALDRGALATPLPLARVLSEKAWRKQRFAVLQTAALIAEFYPPLNGYLSAGAKTPLAVAADALPGFLFDTLPVVRLLGIRALLPKALDRLLRPRLSMQVSGKSAAAGDSFFKAGDLFAFDWQVAVGDHLLTRAEFARLLKQATGVIRFKGEYVYLDPAEIERLRAQLAKPPQLSSAELLRVALAGEYAGAAIRLDAAALGIVQALVEVGEVPLPTGLAATVTLRPYQQRGYAWLYRNACAGFGSVIADDMGLGKTLQVIALLQKLKEDGALADAKALVVVPTSLLTNWQKEIERFAPGLSCAVYHGAKRELRQRRPDVLLTSYGVARSEAATLKAMPWQVLVIDEAQNIKNPATAQTKAVKAIPAQSFVAMSGTPVENRLAEYWSIMDFANRGYLGSLAHFGREYAVPIQTHHDRHVAQRFQRVTAPFLLRRLKSDKSIIGDLPDKIEQNQYCGLSKEQTALYESVLQEALRVIDGESDTFKRQGLVLQMILALKQICNHPAQYLKQGGGAPALSGKAERFLELIDDIHASHEKVLVFTQFREMGELLADWIGQRHGRAPQFLHGGVARAKRDAMVERFQNDRTERVFLLSLKAGGTGLNLTAAANVIHYDLWWNPAVEAQATDRAYRIGQRQNVQVHRLITRATFEERIDAMIRAKRELASLTVGTGETWIGNLGNEELREVFALG
ncbi:MAG: helicase SNF2 [Rhodocyclales bacterium]|nr:helicase SNF2 [Rhodocyclales bacterium]